MRTLLYHSVTNSGINWLDYVRESFPLRCGRVLFLLFFFISVLSDSTMPHRGFLLRHKFVWPGILSSGLASYFTSAWHRSSAVYELSTWYSLVKLFLYHMGFVTYLSPLIRVSAVVMVILISTRDWRNHMDFCNCSGFVGIHSSYHHK